MKMYEYNGKALGMVNGRYRKVWRFSSNEFGKNIGCVVSAPNFGLGGLRLWEKGYSINISGNNSRGVQL